MSRLGGAGGRLLLVVAVFGALTNFSTQSARALAPTASVTAADYGYPYPSAPDCDEVTGANCLSDQWGFVQGQCHSWVAYRLNELNADELNGATFDDSYRMPPGNEWGNPSNWLTAAAVAGVATSSTPAVGSVAWWADDGADVAYVEAVNADGSITISEMNADYHNGFDFATVTPGAGWPDTFVHIADRAVAPTPPASPGSPHAVLGTSGVTVTWSAPGVDGGAPITGYSVVASPGSRVVGASAAARSATFTGLTSGTYTFKVRAANGAGSGAWSSASNAVAVPAGVVRAGYWMLGADGAVYAFGDSVRYGDAPQPMVAMAARRDGRGYWTVDARGKVHSFGAASARGGSPTLLVGEVVSTISPTPSGNGYWLFTNRGRAFRYGDAHVFGDMSKVQLNGPIIASAATASGKGYYMVGSDGGVFSFGDAKFRGSTGALHLNKPIVGISPTPDNKGYWLVASDGGVFAFGASFRGSMGRAHLNQPVNGLVAFGNGYLMVASDGGIFNFSNQAFFGSLAGRVLPAPVIGVAAFVVR